MQSFLNIFPYVLFIAGCAVVVFALKYRVARHPLEQRNKAVSYWNPLWRGRAWFDPPGFLITCIGYSLILLACILMFVNAFLIQ